MKTIQVDNIQHTSLFGSKIFLWDLEKYNKGPHFIGLRDVVKSPNEYVFLRYTDDLNFHVFTFSSFIKQENKVVLLPRSCSSELIKPETIPMLHYLDRLGKEISNNDSEKFNKLGRIELLRTMVKN
jgi:hypothetical protein